MNNHRLLAIVLGAGNGLGLALATRFHEAGYQVVSINRSAVKTRISDIEQITLDASDSGALNNALEDCISRNGVPTVAIHNTAELFISPYAETTAEDFERVWRSNVLTAHHFSQAVIPKMVDAGKGTLLFSGATASLRGGKLFSAFSSAKFALRGLAQSLAREYQPQNIHVCHVVLDGILDTPRSRQLHNISPDKMMDTRSVADMYIALTNQNPSTWTHELDLRPQSEVF